MHHLKISLKVIPLSPLIPGIDEHQRLWQLVEGLLISKDGAQPVAVGGWCGAVEDVGAAMPAAGCVVPGGGDAREAGVVHWRAGQHGGDDVGVGEHIVGAEWMGAGQAELVEELPAEGGLQWRWDGSPVGLEVESGIEAIELGVAVAFGGEAFHLHQIEAIEAGLLGELAPKGGGGAGIREPGSAVDEEEGFVVDADVARIMEIGEQGAEMGFVVGEGVVLGDQHFLVLTVPAASPVFVGPAEAEGEIGLA